MKRMMKLLGKAKLMSLAVGLAVLGILSLIGATPVGAVESESPRIAMGLLPTVHEIALKEGESATYTVTVVNDGKVALIVNMLAVPYTMTDDYSSNIFDAPSTRTQVTNWVKFEEADKEFRLEPNEQRKINFTITVPESSPGGGQYGAVAARASLADVGDGGVAATYQISSLLLLNIDGTTERGGEVVDREYGGWYGDGEISTGFTVKNTGNTHFFVTSRLTVKSAFGGEIIAEVKDESQKVIFGGESRDFDLQWTADSIGFYHVTQDVSFLGEVHTETRLVVILPVWIIILTIIAVIAVVIVIIHMIKSWRNKRSRRIKRMKRKQGDGKSKDGQDE